MEKHLVNCDQMIGSSLETIKRHLVNNVREEIVASYILFNSQSCVAVAKVFSEMKVIYDYLEGK